jgi:DNA (cytosine-5)-methyltransferase 1
VFVVGYLGNWQRAAAVLFERHSLCGYPAPSREKGKSVAPSVTTGAPFSRTGNDRVEAEAYVPAIANTLGASPSCHSSVNVASGQGDVIAFDVFNQDLTGQVSKTVASRNDQDTASCIAQPIALAENTIGRKPENGGNGDGFTENGPMYTLNATGVHGVAQPIAFDAYNQTTSETVAALRCAAGGVFDNTVAQTMSFPWQSALDPIGKPTDLCGTLIKNQTPAVMHSMAVRRLTPTECERLQGFPDGYTDIMPRGKATPDGPRYKTLGNSMAVPVMAWIGKRIQEVEAING